MPYQLRCTIDVVDAVAGVRLTTTVDGDLRGPASLVLTPSGDGTDARLAWELELRAPVLRSLVRVARPAMAWAHDRIVERGLVQFEAHALDCSGTPTGGRPATRAEGCEFVARALDRGRGARLRHGEA